MAEEINLRPAVLNLKLYAGDGFAFKLVCKDTAGNPIDMGGSVAAEIRLDRLQPDNPPIIFFATDLVDAYLGVVGLSLTGDQTQSLSDDLSAKDRIFTGVWDVEWTPSGAQPRTICQGVVECVPDVTE